MDKIQLRGMKFYAYHGVNEEEQSQGQRFTVDVELEKDLRPAGTTDDLSHTINYAHVYKLVKQVMEGPSYKLVESLAETIAQGILQTFDVESVGVKVIKPEVPMKGSFLDYAGVEITRQKVS